MKIVRLFHNSTHTQILAEWEKLRSSMDRENRANTRLNTHPISILPNLNVDTDKAIADWFFGHYFPKTENLQLPCIIVINDKDAHCYTGENCIENFRSEFL